MSNKRRGLGRGLDALLGEAAAAGPQTASSAGPADERASNLSPTELPVEQLVPNRFQPRTEFAEEDLAELADSIKNQGIVQPIVVSPVAGDLFTIIAGERRWRAAKLAGLERVPVVVRAVEGDRQLLELALVENIQRSDLNPIEEAEAYRALNETFELAQDQIAERVGKARTTITNLLRLLRLPAPIQDMIRAGKLSAGQARPILSFSDPRKQIAVAERALREGLTARDLENLAAEAAGQRRKAPVEQAGKKDADVHTRAATEKLTRYLQTKVEIQRRNKPGTGSIRIFFHSEAELIRLFDHLTREE